MEVDDNDNNVEKTASVFIGEIVLEFISSVVDTIDTNPYLTLEEDDQPVKFARTRGHIKANNKPVVTDYHKDEYVGPDKIPICLPKTATTIDPDPLVECEVFETRQNFLNYCTKNSTQFDELRRAKHTTMMLLYQLHNPDAAKFVTTCASCYKEMNYGIYHKCRNCPMYDLCNRCFTHIIMGNPEQRVAHDKTHKFVMIDVDKLKATTQTKEEREKKHQGYLRLVSHVFQCFGECNSKNCKRFKQVRKYMKIKRDTHTFYCAHLPTFADSLAAL